MVTVSSGTSSSRLCRPGPGVTGGWVRARALALALGFGAKPVPNDASAYPADGASGVDQPAPLPCKSILPSADKCGEGLDPKWLQVKAVRAMHI